MRNTRDDVVDAAMRVLDEYGLESCSMRRVAAELGVQPSALYHHVADKQSLLGFMAERIVAGVRGNSPLEVCLATRRALLATTDGAEVVATALAFRLDNSPLEEKLADLTGSGGARTLLLY